MTSASNNGSKVTKTLGKVLGTGVIAGLSCLAWSFYETRHPKIRYYDLKILPKESEAVNILHISDLHFRGKKSRWLARWLNNIDLFDVDLVLSTGDNLGAEKVNDEVLSALSRFLKLPGAFVFGSNDYYAPKKKNPLKYFFIKSPVEKVENEKNILLDSKGLADSFVEAGWINLNNASGTLSIPQGKIELIGIDDPHIGRGMFSEEYPDFKEDSNDDKPIVRIGLAHAPYLNVLSEFERLECNLSCFGHTHGGQLCVPLFGALVSNCDLPPVYASGVFSLKEIFSYVTGVTGKNISEVVSNNVKSVNDLKGYASISAGLGTSPMIPLRFSCAPEVSIIRLLPSR